MPVTAHIDVAKGEQPSPGEKFIISLQENSEMLGELDDGRTFRFVSPSSIEHDYQQQNFPLTVVGIDIDPTQGNEARLSGSITYTD
jgi:hypothetical protein